mgnify:CR=1 FL=1
MEKGLSLLKYTLNTPTKSIFSREFSTTPVLGNFRNIFLNDYLNLQKYIQGFNYISTFIFKFGEDAVVVTKIHDKAVTEIKVNKEKYEKDFFELLKERYGVSITTGKWGSRILDIQKNPSINLNNFITDLNSKIEVVQDNKTDIEELKRAIFANKNEEEVSKIEKMIKSMKDILKYEKQIEDYQNSKTIAEDLRKKSTELANEKKQLEESINSIDLLTNSKKEIETKLATMGLSNSSLNINPSKEVIIQERMSKFKGLKKTQYNSINSVNDTTGKVLEGKVLIVFIGVQIILTLLLYLIEPD